MFHESLQTTGRLKHPHATVRCRSDDCKRVESHDCPMSTCAAPAGSPCRTGKGKVAIQYHTARFRLVSQLTKVLNVPTPAVRTPGSVWAELPRPASAGAEPVGHVRLGYARGPPPVRPGDEPARHRGPARHHQGQEEGAASSPPRPSCECCASTTNRPLWSRRRRRHVRRSRSSRGGFLAYLGHTP